MTCACISYNQPKPWQTDPEIILDPRAIFPAATKTVCVDACIADNILALWRAGVWTRGCCCGHGKGFPEVYIDKAEHAAMAAEVLSRDPRQWRIAFYTEKGAAS